MAYDGSGEGKDGVSPSSDTRDGDGSQSSKVVPIRPTEKKPLGHPRLDEIRRLLNEAEPAPAPDPAPDPEDDLSDDNVIRSRAAFRRRFGVGFDWLPHHRKALIALIHEYGLTDREVKLFRHTGNLKRTPLGVELTGSPWIALWGGLQLVVFGAVFGALCIATIPNLIANPGKALRAVIGLGGLFALCYAIFWLYIKPWIARTRSASV